MKLDREKYSFAVLSFYLGVMVYQCPAFLAQQTDRACSEGNGSGSRNKIDSKPQG